MQRSRSPANDGGRAAVAAEGFIDRRRSRSGSCGSGSGDCRRRGAGASAAAAAAAVGAPPGGSDPTRPLPHSFNNNGISPRGQRKDVLMYSYLMHHQLQQHGKRRRRSSFFRRRNSNSQESNNSNSVAHELSGEQQQQQQEQEQELGSSRRRRQQGGGDNNSNTNLNSDISYGNDSRKINNDDGSNNNGEQRYPKQQHQRNNHAWVLPPHIKLAPRMDIWMMLTVSSCAAVASICQTFVSASTSSNNNSSFSGGDTVALSTCILTFLTSLLMACGVRYTPFRKGMTMSLFVNNSGVVSRLQLTMEIVVLTVLSILWIVSIPVIVNGNAYYNSSMDGSWGVPLAVAGYDIWNANLFYSSWISFLLCGYLWIEVFTLHDRGGTTIVALQRQSGDDHGGIREAVPTNAFTKRWSFLLCTALILMSSSITTYTSPVCQGEILKSTSYCKLALTGIIVGGVFQLFITFCVGLVYRLSYMNRSGSDGSNRDSTTILTIRQRDLLTSVAAFTSLVLQIINTAVLTSPMGGGPGNISGTLYFSCWLGFVLSFELCLRYLDAYSTASRDISEMNPRSISEDDLTVYEDSDAQDSDRDVGMNCSSDEEKANRSMGMNAAPKQNREDVDNSPFVFPQPKPVERKTPSPATNIKEVGPGKREPSVASSTERSDPEGVASNLFQKAPSPTFNDSSPSIDPDGVFGASYFTSVSMNTRKRDNLGNNPYEKRMPSTRMKEPDAINVPFQGKSYPNNIKETLGDVQAPPMKRYSSTSSLSTKRSNLSPLVEGNAEDLSPDDTSPQTILGNLNAAHPVGNSGRNTPSPWSDTRQGQQQQQQADRTKSTKPVASTRSSRSRSREKVVQSSYPLSSLARSSSKQSRHSTTPPQQKVPLVSALLGSQRYSRSGSGGQSKSPKTASSRAVESTSSTPDDSGSNPPPTISDGMSSKEDLSDDANRKNIGSNEYRGPPPPPPPPLPFQNPRINSPPMQSIRTSIDGQGETDSIVSEPTLDAGLDDSIATPSPRLATRPMLVFKNSINDKDSHQKQQQQHHNSSSSITSYEKKDSDDTNLRTRSHSLSSDEVLSSKDGQTGIKVVDDIVAAALAYAEMTHGVASGSRGTATAVRRGSGTTTAASSQHHPMSSITPQSSQKMKPTKGDSSQKQKKAKSVSGESASSSHSYYSKKRGGASQHDRRTGPGGRAPSTPVEELLVKAFSQAHHGHGRAVGEQNQPRLSRSVKSGISVESVYSEEDTEFSVRADYDC